MKPRRADLVTAWLVALALLVGLAMAPLPKTMPAGDAQVTETSSQRLKVRHRETVTPARPAAPAAAGATAHEVDTQQAKHWFRESLDRL